MGLDLIVFGRIFPLLFLFVSITLEESETQFGETNISGVVNFILRFHLQQLLSLEMMVEAMDQWRC